MKKRMKALLACILVFVLTISNFSGINLANNVEEAQAEETLTKITWTDFGMTYGSTYNTGGIFVYSRSLNNTAFEGDISMPAGGGFRYATYNGYFGMNIQVNADGQLVVGTSTMYMNGVGPAAENKFDAATFGLKTFVGARFTLKIEMREVTETSAKATVYVNGTAVADAFTLTSWDNGSNDAFKIAPKIAFNTNGCGTEATIYKTSPELKKIKWTDFGFEYGKTFRDLTPDSNYNNAKESETLKTIKNTELTGDIVMDDNSTINYGGVSWVQGLAVMSVDSALKFANNTTGTSVKISKDQAIEYGLKSFVNEQFTLKIQIIESSNDQYYDAHIYI